MLLNILRSCFGPYPYNIFVTEDPFLNYTFLFLCACVLIMFFLLKRIKVYPIRRQDGWKPIYQTLDVLGQEMNNGEQTIAIPNRKIQAIFQKIVIFFIVITLILTPLKSIVLSNPALKSYWGF